MIPIFTKALRAVVTPVVDILSPHVCVLCERLLEHSRPGRSSFICGSCLDSLDTALSPEEIFNDLLVHFPDDELCISAAFSCYSAPADTKDGILEAIHCLKYRGFSRMGVELGRELGEILLYRGCPHYALMLPVPIHAARRRERGYNQAECIAQGVSEILHIPVDVELLHRVRYTSTQTRLSKDDRVQNVHDAFSASTKFDQLIDRDVLVIDDVLTTGSTLNSIARSLLERGVRRVDVATIVKAL